MGKNRVAAQVSRTVYYVLLLGITLVLAATSLVIVSSPGGVRSIGILRTRSKRPCNEGTTASLAFSKANTAGNLIVVYVVWDNPGTVQVSDSKGNTYTAASDVPNFGVHRSRSGLLRLEYPRRVEHRQGDLCHGPSLPSGSSTSRSTPGSPRRFQSTPVRLPLAPRRP